MPKEEKTSGFGGIFKKLGEMAMKPEYLEEVRRNQPEQEAEVPVEQPLPKSGKTVFATSTPLVPFTPTGSGPSQADIQTTVDKIHGYLESINKPGVDFLEFWNAVEAMDGGITTANIKNAFVAIKMMSGNAVTKVVLMTTGNAYVNELTQAINGDIAGKSKTKKDLQKSLDLEKVSLESQVNSLRTQITALNTELQQKEAALTQISSKYAPQMQEVDNSIACGTTALNVVINEINSFIGLVDTTIQ